MKAAFAFLLLAPLALATPQLPTIDLAVLKDGTFEANQAEQGHTTEGAALTAAGCPAGYPFLCDGHCCVYNICCTAQCCLPDTDFCGADGLCYRYS